MELSVGNQDSLQRGLRLTFSPDEDFELIGESETRTRSKEDCDIISTNSFLYKNSPSETRTRSKEDCDLITCSACLLVGLVGNQDSLQRGLQRIPL